MIDEEAIDSHAELNGLTKLKLKQFEVAHSSTILLYSRDRSGVNLAKKLRAEFGKILVSSESRECQKVLSKITNESQDYLSIDVLLADFDTGAVKIVDTINKRPLMPETNNCSLIPTIVMANESNQKDAIEHLAEVGGVNKLLVPPYTTKKIMSALLEVLFNRKRVEDTFRDLKKHPTISAKYPYLPIFENSTTAEGNTSPSKLKDLLDYNNEKSVLKSTVSSSTAHEHHMEEIEDGTECSSMIPDDVKQVRQLHTEFKPKFIPKKVLNKNDMNEDDVQQYEDHFNDRLGIASFSKSERSGRRSSSVSQHTAKSPHGVEMNAKATEAEADGANVTKMDDNIFVLPGGGGDISIDLLNSNHARADGSFYSQGESMIKDQLSETADHQQDKAVKDIRRLSVLPVLETNAKNEDEQANAGSLPTAKVKELLKADHRPFWGEDAEAVKSKLKSPAAALHDIGHFINKTAPHISFACTVGGLDKRTADQYWKLVKNPIDAQDELAKAVKAASRHFNTSNTRGSILTAASHYTQTTQKTTKSNKSTNNRPHSTGRSPGHRDTSDLILSDKLTDHREMYLKDHRHHSQYYGNNNSPSPSPKRVGSMTGSLPASPTRSAYNLFNSGSMTPGSNLFIKDGVVIDTNKTYQKIANLAKQSAPDVQVSTILDIDFSSRLINLGEKDMLERGMNLEQNGDYESAIIYYTRAGAHSKDQQISRMLLGNLHYRLNKLLSALKYYSMAIDIINKKAQGLRLSQDIFLAHYNRAIIGFRLGDDESAIRDLEVAIQANPTHHKAREILSLAKRRLGKYSQAIEDAIVNKNIRQEEARKERQKLLMKANIRAQQATSCTILPALGLEHMYNNNQNEQIAQQTDASSPMTAPSIMNMQTSLHPSNKRESPRRVGSPTTDGQPILQESSLVTMENSLVFDLAAAGNASNAVIQLNASKKQAQPTVKVDVLDPDCGRGLKTKIIEAIDLAKGELIGNFDNGGFLKLFKLQHGFKMELFNELFVKPTELQQALMIDPHKRMPVHLDIIGSALRLFPFLRSFSSSSVHELSGAIEYRILTTKETLFAQNEDSCATLFLLKGNVQAKLEFPSMMLDFNLDEFHGLETFGHIDFLFRRPSKALMKIVEEVLFPVNNANSSGSNMNGNGFTSSVGNLNQAVASNDPTWRRRSTQVSNHAISNSNTAISPTNAILGGVNSSSYYSQTYTMNRFRSLNYLSNHNKNSSSSNNQNRNQENNINNENNSLDDSSSNASEDQPPNGNIYSTSDNHARNGMSS